MKGWCLGGRGEGGGRREEAEAEVDRPRNFGVDRKR
jgi:hypothetical protein